MIRSMSYSRYRRMASAHARPARRSQAERDWPRSSDGRIAVASGQHAQADHGDHRPAEQPLELLARAPRASAASWSPPGRSRPARRGPPPGPARPVADELDQLRPGGGVRRHLAGHIEAGRCRQAAPDRRLESPGCSSPARMQAQDLGTQQHPATSPAKAAAHPGNTSGHQVKHDDHECEQRRRTRSGRTTGPARDGSDALGQAVHPAPRTRTAATVNVVDPERRAEQQPADRITAAGARATTRPTAATTRIDGQQADRRAVGRGRPDRAVSTVSDHRQNDDQTTPGRARTDGPCAASRRPGPAGRPPRQSLATSPQSTPST